MQCPLIFGYLFIFMNENLILIKNHVYKLSSYTPGHNTRLAARCWKNLNYTPQNQSQNKRQRLLNTQLQKLFFFYRYNTLLQKLPCLKAWCWGSSDCSSSIEFLVSLRLAVWFLSFFFPCSFVFIIVNSMFLIFVINITTLITY